MKKLILSCIFGITSLVYAAKPLPLNPSDNSEVSQTNVISSQNFFISNTYDEKAIPQDLKRWIPWVNKNNYAKNCVESICVFIPKLTVQKLNDKNTVYSFVFEGTSLTPSAWVALPSSDSIWPLSVKINGQDSPLVNHEGKDFVQVPQKDFKIQVEYNSSIFDKKSSFEIPFNVVSFDNQTGQNLSLKDTILSLNDIQNNNENNSFQDIKVFRKFSDNIPYQLDTNLIINFSGKTKELDLGVVLPAGFKLTEINSDLQVIFKDNHYYATLIPGTHFINFQSFANKEINTFLTKGLILNTESEIWSIQKNNNIRNIDIKSASVVDPKQVSVPQSWSQLPAYLVLDKLDIVSSQQGLSLNTDLKINAQRTTVFGFNDTAYSLDHVSLNNQNTKELTFNSNVLLQSVSLSQPKMILSDKNKNYVLLNSSDNSGTIQFDTPKNHNIVSQLSNSYYVDSWKAGFIPRTDLIWTTNAKVTSSDFWFNAWNLYSLFSLSILIIALYKLIGKEAAFFALFSLVSFYSNNSVFWIFWILLVVSYAFNKYLPEKYINFKRNTNHISLIGTSLVVLFALQFVFNEIFSIIHPNVSHKLYFSPLSFLITILVIFISYKLFNKIFNHFFHKENKKTTLGWLFILLVILFGIPSLLSFTISTLTGYSQNNSGILSSSLRGVDDYTAAPASLPMVTQKSMQVGINNNAIKTMVAPLDEISSKQEQESSEKNKKEDFNSISMIAKSKANIVRHVAQEKVQIGHAFVKIDSLHFYTLIPSNKDSVHFYIAEKWMVNLYGILQSVFLLLLAYILVVYNLFLFKKGDFLNKLPTCFSCNYLVRKVQSKINEA